MSELKTEFVEQQEEYWCSEDLNKRRSPQHPVIKEYVVSKIDEIKKYIPVNKNTTILDVGCGNGFFTYYFDQIADAHGVDFSAKMISLNPVKKKSVMDGADLKFDDDSFDIVFCHALLHHLPDIDKMVSEFNYINEIIVPVNEFFRNEVI